jgi:hypothetical protein
LRRGRRRVRGAGACLTHDVRHSCSCGGAAFLPSTSTSRSSAARAARRCERRSRSLLLVAVAPPCAASCAAWPRIRRGGRAPLHRPAGGRGRRQRTACRPTRAVSLRHSTRCTDARRRPARTPRQLAGPAAASAGRRSDSGSGAWSTAGGHRANRKLGRGAS